MTDRNLKASKEYVRTLKLQLARNEEQIYNMRRERNGETVQFTEFDELLSNQAILQKKYDDCESELLQLRKVNHSDKVQLEDLNRQMAEFQRSSKSQISESQAELEQLRMTVATLASEKNDLLEIVEKLKSGLGMYKQQLEQSEIKRREVRK
jgi:predicted  nucleic acid-binding Zn-ribbon protein